MTSTIDPHFQQPFCDPLTAASKRMLPSASVYHTGTMSSRNRHAQGSFSSNTDSSVGAANRLSTMESSHNENNQRTSRRPSGLSTAGSSSSGAATDGLSTPTWTQKDFSTARSSGGSNAGTVPAFERQPSSSEVGDGDSVVIEEKRRRAHGDGHSVHRYLRGRLLGKGGFAKVYLCTALDTNKNYAVKIVPKANLVKERARQKLQAEIKIHRTLKHDNICEYKHFFEDRDNCYILLELCHNQSMNEMIKRRKSLTEPEAIFFMLQMLEAVRYMHENNVIHRDLKLGNLFLDRHLNMKVGDLGLATRLEDKDEKRKTICGTPNYIAPEIIQGDKSKRGHSFEVDIWSMGVILYTVLVGKPPYEAKDVKATYQRIINNEYSFPKHVTVSDYAKDLIGSMLQSVPSARPSLDQICAHPFLTETLVPSSLPTSATHVAPVWQINEYGEIVIAEVESVRKSASSRKPIPPRSSSGRQPFGSYDPNRAKSSASVVKPKEKPGRDAIDMQGMVKNAVAMVGSTFTGTTTPASSGFKIFDESRDAPAAATPSGLEGKSVRQLKQAAVRPSPPSAVAAAAAATADAELVARTKYLAIATPASRKVESMATTVHTSPVGESEAEVLQRMVERVETVIDITEARTGSYRSYSPKPLSRGGPTKWVTRYVDYTSKYGLGFLLNEGSSGVYFNDSTKTALEPDGETFQYIERLVPPGNDPPPQKVESSVETFTLSRYPESLKKKVTLLKHFRNYLLEQQKKADEDDSVVPSSVNAVAHEALVYVKKWVRTKHAILFRLSDQTIQIVFYDQTEILLTPDDRFITYVDKSRNRLTYTFTDELIGNHAELAKRLKYTKEILQQLLPGQRT